MKKKIIIGLFAILLLATGCGKIPKLANGQEAIVAFDKEGKISVDDYYNKLKDNFGLNILITMIDTYIMEHEFPDYVEQAKSSAENELNAMLEQYGGESELLNLLRNRSPFQTIDAFYDNIYVSYLEDHGIREYAKAQVTDKEIEEYYEKEVIGDMEISHILITPADSEHEEEAKTKANEVIEKLNTAKKNKEDITEVFTSLAKEYSEDESTKDDGGNLGRLNYNKLGSNYDELVDAAKKLKDGEFSTSIITTELGYHVILKVKTYEKDTLENLKESIIETLGTRKYQNDQSISINALQSYRKKYNMEIEDSEMKNQYSNYIQNVLISLQQSGN